MFVPCPHCGYLVALIVPAPASAAATQRCPRCDGLLGFEDAAMADATPGRATRQVTDTQAATGPAPVAAATAELPGAVPATNSRSTRAALPPGSQSMRPSIAPTASDTDRSEPLLSDQVPSHGMPSGGLPSEGMPSESMQEDTPRAGMLPGHASTQVAASDADTAPAPADTVHAPPAEAAATSSSAVAAPPTAPAARRAPSFVRHRHAASTRRRLRWPETAAIAALVLLLALQLLLAQRTTLGASERWRPLVLGACTLLRCDVPPWHEPAAFTMLDRNVRPDPARPGLLVVDASFRNDARWPQRWPTLVLSLSDVDGQEVAVRALAPGDYRPRGARADDLLAPGESASMRVDVVEPAPRIVAFHFEFD